MENEFGLIVISAVSGALGMRMYMLLNQKRPAQLAPPVLTPAKYIPADAVISNNWEAVYRKSGKAQWIVDCDFNTIKVTINRNWTKLNGYAMWDVYTQIYGSGRRPFAGYVSVNNHIEYMDWLRKKYPLNCVHSPEYIERVMKSVYKAMKNPAQIGGNDAQFIFCSGGGL